MTDDETGPDDDGGDAPATAGAAGPEGKRRRRRRRRRGGEHGAAPGAPPSDAPEGEPLIGDPYATTATSGDTPAPSGPSGPSGTPGTPGPSDARPRGDAARPGGGRERRAYRGGGAGPRELDVAHVDAPAPAITDGARALDEVAAAPPTSSAAPAELRARRGDERRSRRDRGRGESRPPGERGARPASERAEPAERAGRPADERGERGGRRDERGRGGRDERGARGDRGRDGRPRRDGGADGAPARTAPTASIDTRVHEAPTARLEQRRSSRPAFDDLDELAPETPAVPWGTDDDSPPPAVALVADLPDEPPDDDPDPTSYPLLDAPSAPLGDDVASVAGVRFVTGGRVQWVDAADADFAVGERVLVDSDRGPRLGWIAAAPTRRPARGNDRLRRVIRRANEQDLRGERDGDLDRARALRLAKDKAAALRLPLKVFRVEVLRGKVNVYYTSDDRLDLRELIRELGTALGARIELRQLGVRDEAKAVGGIGSCGLTLCCTTWLPDFVPVSIKMAKDQGLVLSPTKVSGQCGRLKCCLVYEQAGYAELRKGLPKLGKRVIAPRGEGRVVEVDVLRQRVRVSYGAGDTEVLPASEVQPLFPSGNPPPGGRAGGGGRADLSRAPLADVGDATDDETADPAEATDDPSALAGAPLQPSFVGGAPSPEDTPPELEERLSEGEPPDDDPFANT